MKATIAELFLAYRQAKTALHFEKRGVGMLGLAKYEENLSGNLKNLQKKLANGKWFDELDIGEVWVVPKRLHSETDRQDRVIRIGVVKSKQRRAIDIQMRLSPHPDFAIAEVLYLWKFGGVLEPLLSRNVVGYRLDLREQRLVPHRRWLFEYWPRRYQEFRSAPLEAAKESLSRGNSTFVISGDLANFYDTINPAFMLDSVVAEMVKAGAAQEFVEEYQRATQSLLRATSRFYSIASNRAGTTISIGVPIGALTSRVIANLSLAPLDRYVSSRQGVICYRRYVDDIAIVALGEEGRSQAEVVRSFLPLLDETDGVLRLNVNELGREGSEFQLQTTKIRVHHLAGVPGIDFVEAVASDFTKALSERRAFIDSATLAGDGVSHLIRAGNAEGSPLRVLREADRARLERFALSTSLRSLERVSSLIDRAEARDLVRRCLERVGRVLESEDNWVGDLDVSLRLLKVAIITGDWKSVSELHRRMDRVWGSVESLKTTTPELYFRGRRIDPAKKSPWVWLRNYLHERRLEAICSCLPIGMGAHEIENKFPGGVRLRTIEVKAVMLRRRAEDLARADLRSRDREDDAPLATSDWRPNHDWMRPSLRHDEELLSRLTKIDEFVQRCIDLGDRPWVMPAARLFLCTRPPSYFDIARRLLYRVEEQGFDESVFEHLISIVNAVRGTDYRDTVGSVIDRSTISIIEDEDRDEQADPRIILGNLVVDDACWIGAATRRPGFPYGRPVLTRRRLEDLATVLEKAECASRDNGSQMLVLPELSLPRSWFRAVATHIVRSRRLGLVAGLEYIHHGTLPFVSNQVFTVLPGPFMSAATWPWTKRLPAREEGELLAKLRRPVSFRPPLPDPIPRTVIHTKWGSFSVLICSEMIEARRVSDLLARVNVVLCPAWNSDTASYDHLIQSVGFQLHAIVAIANNGVYSDCRAWAPRTERWERDLCRLVERNVNDIVYVDVPVRSLIDFQRGDKQAFDKYRAVRAALDKRNIAKARAALADLTDDLPGLWRPLPPDW